MKVKEQLKIFTKQSLSDCARNVSISGFSKMNKEELAEAVAAYVLSEEYMFFEIIKLSDNEIEYLLKLEEEKLINTIKDNHIPHGFLMSGYLNFNKDTKTVEWCSDAFELFKSCLGSEECKRLRKLVRKVMTYGNAFAELYGVITFEKAFEIYSKYNSDLDPEEFKMLMMHAEKISTWDIENNKIVAEDLLVYDELEELEYMQQGKPYYIPSKQEIMKYEDAFYIEKNEHYYNLKRFLLKDLHLDEEKAEDVAEDIVLEIEMDGDFENFFMQLENLDIVLDKEEQAEELVYLCNELANNTRLRENRGFTPNELYRLDMRKQAEENKKKSKKIGRNDPCPCGSGKKYKKCCGK